MPYEGMTDDRIQQLDELGEEARKEATEEIWAEMHRIRERLIEIEDAHYLPFGWRLRETSGDATPEENQKFREWLKLNNIAVKQE